MNHRFALFLLTIGIAFSIVLSVFLPYASREAARRATFLCKVIFDAAIITEDVTGVVVNSDGTQGDEIIVPVYTPVHVASIKINEDVRVDTPVQLETDQVR